jgi:hypothetical protein
MNRLLLLLLSGLTFVGRPSTGWALDHVELQRERARQRISGKVLVEAQDGGLLLLDRAHVLWAVTPEELVRREQDAEPFEPLDRAAMAAEMLAQLPDGFRVHNTAHYVVCYNTSAAYAQWCGSLYERLYLAFRNYWQNRGLDLVDPEWPLVALVFDRQDGFANYARAELGDATASIIGYYSLRTNRVTMYDLTGIAGQLPAASTAAHINRLLSRPEAERTVATIIHEATHQLAFNCGLQTRYADIPLWLSEGMAIYFETPDLSSQRGWRRIGEVNRVRLLDFQRYLAQRPTDSLESLLRGDERFRNARLAPDAYAEAWALNYFLIQMRPKLYVRYLEALSRKRPLLYDDPAQRLAQFQQVFGDDLKQLDEEFLRYMRTIR